MIFGVVGFGLLPFFAASSNSLDENLPSFGRLEEGILFCSIIGLVRMPPCIELSSSHALCSEP